jgi:hypothetical protein
LPNFFFFLQVKLGHLGSICKGLWSFKKKNQFIKIKIKIKWFEIYLENYFITYC